MKPKRWTTLVFFLLAAALLAGGAWRLASLDELRTRHDLEPADVNTDAEAAARLRIPTIGLSVFRSLAIDYLWIRADTLKQQGQYFDALHLADLICKLQPNLPSVWKFQAWNMAYNISVAMPTPAERWDWVLAGIKLLRDDGLRACPGEPGLYQELSWYFHHKLGGVSDEFHWYYKEQLARSMMQLVGPNGGTNAELELLARAPRDWDTLLQDPNVVTVIDRLASFEPALRERERFQETWTDMGRNPEKYPVELRQYIIENEENGALIAVDRFLRARGLDSQWRLDPAKMLEVNRRYGPVDLADPEGPRFSLDWRLPFAHGLYWALQGLPDAEPASTESLGLWRLVYGNLQELFHNGRLELLVMEETPQTPEREAGQEIVQRPRYSELRMFLSQDLRMFPAAYEATQEVLREYRVAGEERPKSVEDASEYLVWAGIENLYLLGRVETAGHYYRRLRSDYPDNPDYRLALDEFVRTRLADEVTAMTPKRASAYVDSLLRRAHRSWAQLNDEMAAAFYARADQVYKEYNKQRQSDTNRVAMPPLGQMALMAYQNLLMDPTESPMIKQVLLARLQQERPDLYERIRTSMEQYQGDGPISAQP